MHRIVVAMASRSDREHCESRRHSLDHGVDPGVVWGGRAGWAGPRAGRSGVRSTGIPATLGLVAVLFSVGCGAGERGSAGPVVRDSAGIAIVENGEPIWAAGEGWRVLEEPAVDIGVLDGDPVYQLFDARDAARLASGEIVIANRGTQELRFYDAAGRFLRSAGREGEGPGEFRSLVSVAVVEDSIFAYDIRLNRISVFESTGRFVRSFRLESPADGRSYPSPVGALPDGSLLMGMRG